MAERCNNCNWDRGIHAHRHAHSCLHLYAHVSWTLLSREVLYLNQVEILMEIYQQTQRTTHHHTHSTHTTRTHTSSSYAEEVQTFRKTNVKGKSETKIEIFHSFVERVRRRRWMQCPPWQTLPLFPILLSRFTAPLLSLLPALLLSKAVAIYDLQAEVSTSVFCSRSLSLSHIHTHAYSFANILLEQKSISSLQRLLSLSLTLARCFSFSWSFTVWRF